jgi:O-methyltransferase
MFYGLDKRQGKILGNVLGILDNLFKRTFHADMLITFERCQGFLEDKKFINALKKTATNAQENSLVWRLHTQVWAAHQCLSLPGDFMECGVYKGFCSAFMVNYLDFSQSDKTLFLYDTFAGIPEEHRAGSPVRPGAYNEDGLYESVVARFQPYQNVKVVKGTVPNVFADVCPDAIAYLHLDMNSATAEIGALKVVFNKLVPGGMIVLDDYGWQWYRAQKDAEDKFFAERGYRVLELPTGQGLV